jgi:glycosyltransferase involved in cell wall biosynthesis
VNRFVFDRVDRIIAVSADLAEKARQMGADETRLQVIRNGVDVAQFTPLFTPPGSEIVWVGRMVPVKGLEYLIQAMPTVFRAVPEARLILVGDGPLRPALQSQVEELGITDVVRFVGLTHHSRVIEYLQSASMLVLPSLSEGCPLVVLEAFAAGTPVVASRVGGVPEVVAEGESGLLVSPADPAALAEAIIELLTDSQKRERFARAGRSRVERELSWDSVATETCQVYADVAGGNGHAW